ncbi:MAG: hypothetical protein FJ213_04970 [Ignavibacteria bacterium]|nr:hypothetical protein [Ignavibacteria bacterium]
MNTGQTLMVIVGILLLTVFILTVYRASTARITISLVNEATISATGIAQSIIDEIQMKAFDENTTTSGVSSTNSLTAVGSLGPETGETQSTLFDDIDDYNNFTRSDSLSRMGTFNTKVQVYYVQKMTPETKSLSKTFTKRIDVFVFNFSLTDTLKLYHIVSY